MNQLIVAPANIQELSLIENLLDKMQVKYRELSDNLYEEQERKDWHNFAVQNLSRAYSEDEPEYTSAMLTELNPEFKV